MVGFVCSFKWNFVILNIPEIATLPYPQHTMSEKMTVMANKTFKFCS